MSNREKTVLKILFALSLFVVFLVATFFMVASIDIINGIYPAESKLRVAFERMGYVRATWLMIKYYILFALLTVGSIVGIVLIIHSLFSRNKE